MPADDEPDDAAAFGPPPPPDDRLWRHPSELGAGPPVTIVAARPTSRRVVTVGLLSGVLGAAAMLGLVFALGAFDADRGPVAVEQIQLSEPKVPAPSELAIAEKVFPAVARVDTGGSTQTSGTAIVFRDDGHLLTTADAVEGAQALTVQLYDGSIVPATVVGVDRSSDIAVIKVDRAKLPTVVLAVDGSLQLGEPTIAIECVPGKPGTPDVSVGLISALGQRVDAENGDSLHGMIQTNVRVRPSSSGAALVDSTGAVIGLVTHRGLRSGDPGKGSTTTTKASTLVPRYATPIGYAKSVADELISTGRVTHPWLGVESSDLSDDEVQALGRSGARIERVMPGSPAESAGLQVGDIVLGVDSTAVSSSSDLVVALRTYRPNQSVGITYSRSGDDAVALATLGEKVSAP